VRARITAKPKPKAAPKLTPEQMLLCEQLRPLASGGRLLVRPEYRFHATRKHRIDVAIDELGAGYGPIDVVPYEPVLAIEIDGGGWTNGRHSRGAGIEKDCEKSALIAAAGYRLIRVTPKQVRTGQALAWIKGAL
jgi:hypothetical protein